MSRLGTASGRLLGACLTLALVEALEAGSLAAQALRSIRGETVSASEGTPLQGVTIVPEGKGRAVVSGPSGTFQISLPTRPTRLIAMGVGLAPETVTVASGATAVRFRLRPGALSLEPLTVTAAAAHRGSTAAIRELDLRLRPRESSQDLLRLIPGVVIAQHAGGGKAEQIYARGFDADHGTDVAISVDGVPVNMVSHAHGQGYADLHFLMPEVVESIDARKGPSDARDGDFATAAAITFRTRDRIPGPTLIGRAGSHASRHLLAMVPFGGDASLPGGFVAVSEHRSDGYFDSPQDYRRFNFFGKWTAPVGHRARSYASLSAFQSGWDASGQIPERAVDAGRIGRFGAIDASEGGETERYDLTVGLKSTVGGTDRWEVQAYAVRYRFDLFSNFTFYLNDAVNGDGIEQEDDRHLGGGRAWYSRVHGIRGRDAFWETGIGTRWDDAEVGLYHQRSRNRLSARVDTRIRQGNLFTWAQETIHLSDRVRLQLGLRADAYRFEVADRLQRVPALKPLGSATEWRGIVSPKASLAFDVSAGTSLHANLGTGFHSNDARDVMLAGRGQRVLPRAVGSEIGARRSWADGSVAATAWVMDLESELIYVGDEGVTEPSGRTRRTGLDLEARARLLPWLWADADLSLARGRFRDEPIGAHLIPLAPNLTSTGGLRVRDLGPWETGLRYRAIDSRPADERGSVTAHGNTLVELFGVWKLSALSLVVAVDNLLDAEWNEAQFATTSRLPGERDPVTELHFTPGAPRSYRVGVEYRF